MFMHILCAVPTFVVCLCSMFELRVCCLRVHFGFRGFANVACFYVARLCLARLFVARFCVAQLYVTRLFVLRG